MNNVSDIKALLAAEIDDFATPTQGDVALLEAFQRALCEPREITVNFSGGVTQRCWSVTQPDGDYRVIYLPTAGYFSLCVESVFGPLDIGVHGQAIKCFASV